MEVLIDLKQFLKQQRRVIEKKEEIYCDYADYYQGNQDMINTVLDWIEVKERER